MALKKQSILLCNEAIEIYQNAILNYIHMKYCY